MQERMDNLYDRIAELEEAITDVETKIGASYGKQVTGKKIYQFLLDFDILYGKMTDLEKKEFMRTFIESIELDPDEKDMGRIIKHIDLTFPVYFDGQEGDRIRMPKENTVETVVLLGRKKVDEEIVYAYEDYEPKDSEYLNGTKGSATYREIKEWVKSQHGLSVSSLYIAQVKEKCGLEKRENFNLGAEGHRVPTCPPEKREAILSAFRHFNMI